MPTHTPTTQGFADRRFDTAIQAALGKPWVVLGRGPDTFDCWGLVLWVYKAAGVVLPDFAYDIQNDRATLFQTGSPALAEAGWEPVATPSPYSIVTLGQRHDATHVAIWHPSGIYYHCLERQGVVGYNSARIDSLFRTKTFWRRKCHT